MRINHYLCVFCIALAYGTGCKKPCQDVLFEYNGSDIFYPEADSIKIGDTLYLSCIIRKSALASNLNKQENLGGNLIVSSVDSFANSNRGAVQSFNYFNIQGQLYSDS